VYVLTEFVFCPRAGLCTHEQPKEIDDPDTKPSATYLPIHDQTELELMLKETLRQFLNILLGGGAATVLLALMAWLSGWLILWGLLAGVGLLTAYALYDRFSWIVTMRAHLKIWKAAHPQLPDPDSAKIQYVHWCELMAAGFMLTEAKNAYSHPPWRLGGKPWRLLEHGELRIPVFMPGRPWKDLFPQHFVRMAAYCRLIELCEGFKSPYGVIVMPDSFQAIIVPCTPKSREDFEQALYRARKTIRDAEEQNARPPEPSNGNLCRECPHGEPRAFRKGKVFMRGDIPLTPSAFPGKDGKQYHSLCGDRFQWTPSHATTEQLKPSPWDMGTRR
jgi:hypothetical protein